MGHICQWVPRRDATTCSEERGRRRSLAPSPAHPPETKVARGGSCAKALISPHPSQLLFLLQPLPPHLSTPGDDEDRYEIAARLCRTSAALLLVVGGRGLGAPTGPSLMVTTGGEMLAAASAVAASHAAG